MQHLDPQIKNFAVQEYGGLSWWALFARDYPLAEHAALRCLELSPQQTWVYTNLGHAQLLRGVRDAGQVSAGVSDNWGKLGGHFEVTS